MTAVPAELRERAQWVVWRAQERDGKTTKVPYRADGAGRASSTDPATWSTYDAAVAASEALSADGIGYVFAASDPFVGIDLDDLDDAAAAIIEQLDSYTEYSVSLAGAHVIVRASLNGHPRNRKGPLEIYDAGRYFVITGQHVSGTPNTIQERQRQLDEVLAEYLPAPAPADRPTASVPVDLDDRELLEKAMAARNGDEFAALWNGDWQGRFASQSEADIRLAGMLAFWTGRDADRIDRLFRQSGLAREKWNRDDYSARTIEAAIAGTRDVYTPRPRIATKLAEADVHAYTERAGEAPAIDKPHRHLTDIGNAQRLVDRHGIDLRYCHPWAKWLIWNGSRWLADDSGEAERRWKETVRSFYADLAEIEDDEKRKLYARHITASESSPRVRAALELARSEVPILPDQLDADDWVLNVENGTIDLRTGELRPHRRTDLISKIAPVRFDPDAVAERWLAALVTVLPDEDVRAYFQRLIGYALVGVTTEQILPILYGAGANGKTTVTETIRALLGDYSQVTPAETFVERRETIPNDVARLRGVRLALATKLAEGRRLNEALVKKLTGTEALVARFMRGEWFEFEPKFLPLLVTNHRPIIRGTDEAIWRRLRLIPFTVTIPPAERDQDLPGKLRHELPGILQWAIQGCLAWQRDGLGLPDAVNAATEEYRTDSDTLGRFLEDCCTVAPDARVRAADVLDAYQHWAKDNGEPELSQQKLGRRLTDRGFKAHRTKSTRMWLGLDLAKGDG
jgi:putative DNA primase/helicase